ncbi:MAG: internal scaffolding protein [Arizlama microvirus]|nr:MAG: internal scaffolding protein [Arizlama microvirus]
MSVTIKTKYEYETHTHPGVDFKPKTNRADRSLTNQADMESADINKIMARYEKTGVLIDASGVERKPQYGDFTVLKDYHSMMSAVRNAERAFDLLPANVKNRFLNDPQKLIDFLENPVNDKEAVSLGLKERDVLLTHFDPDRPGVKVEKEVHDSILALTAERRKSRQDAIAKLPAQAAPGQATPPA